jgi:hypothetical protein
MPVPLKISSSFIICKRDLTLLEVETSCFNTSWIKGDCSKGLDLTPNGSKTCLTTSLNQLQSETAWLRFLRESFGLQLEVIAQEDCRRSFEEW